LIFGIVVHDLPNCGEDNLIAGKAQGAATVANNLLEISSRAWDFVTGASAQ